MDTLAMYFMVMYVTNGTRRTAYRISQCHTQKRLPGSIFVGRRTHKGKGSKEQYYILYKLLLPHSSRHRAKLSELAAIPCPWRPP